MPEGGKEAGGDVGLAELDAGGDGVAGAQAAGEPGLFTSEFTVPTGGRYVVHTEFRRRGAMTDLVDGIAAAVDGSASLGGHADQTGLSQMAERLSGIEEIRELQQRAKQKGV